MRSTSNLPTTQTDDLNFRSAHQYAQTSKQSMITNEKLDINPIIETEEKTKFKIGQP